MITLKRLTNVYRTTEVETAALRGINHKVEVTEFVAIMSPSGCRKSAFLNIVGMLDNPSVVMATHSHSHVEYAHRVVNRLDGSIVTETTRQALRG